jgi:hypothetical protein
MNPKKGLVGKELKPSPGGATKPHQKSVPGAKGVSPKEAGPGGQRNLLELDEVAERLRVPLPHVEKWLKEGLLKGSASGVQVYELEKFKVKNVQEIRRAQSAPPPAAPAAAAANKPQKSLSKKSGGKKPAEPSAQPPKSKAEKSSPSFFGAALSGFRSLFRIFPSTKKPEKVEPYVEAFEDFEEPPAPSYQPAAATERFARPVEAAEPASQVTAAFTTSQIAAAARGELEPPPPPSSEVWPSLENLTKPATAPKWLKGSVEEAPHETLILKSDQLAGLAKASGGGSRELQDEKQRNQQLLQQLQEQRRAELDLQDELETLRQRLELSLSGEREVRSQLKRVRQELQTALEELEQRSPTGVDNGELESLRHERQQWESERTLLEQQKNQLDQRRVLAEQQMERLRAQAEEIRQHGLQWHQLAVQQDQQLKALRKQHTDLEAQASQTLSRIEAELSEAQAARQRAEQKLQDLEQHSVGGASVAELAHKDKAIQQLQMTIDQMQSQMLMMENQQKAQVQRWEQELQASASWVQKLTEAVTQRDRKLAELENQSQSKADTSNEEELKAQVMSLKVELTSLKRNFEVASLQAKSLEQQLAESRRQATAAPTPVLSLELGASSAEDEAGFRKRLGSRLAPPPEEVPPPRKGLEPPPFLELDIPSS